MEKMDKKYAVEMGQGGAAIVKAGTYTEVPDDEWILFRAKDNALLPTLHYYLNKCRELECPIEHRIAIADLINRVVSWRHANIDKCKNPD
jgi:hypothetical protein